VLAPAPSRHDRMSMHNANKLKIGLFGRTARLSGRSRSFRSAGPGAGRTISSSPGWPTTVIGPNDNPEHVARKLLRGKSGHSAFHGPIKYRPSYH
jgi:hypothetical protein